MLGFAAAAWFASADRPHCAEAGQRGNPTSGPHSLRIGPNGDELVFDGFITEGVAAEFARLLKSQRNVKVIRLDSPGGRLFEAQRIGELIRRRNIDTFVSGRCFSACTIVFLNGKERRIDFGARLGFHQASFPGMGAEGRRRAMALQGGMLRQLGMPADFVRKVNATPPQDIWIPSTFELMAAHVVTGSAVTGVGNQVAKFESDGPGTRVAGFLGPGPVRDKFVSAASAACLKGEGGAQATAGELSCRCYADRLADIVTDVEAERFASGDKTLATFKDRSGIAIKQCFAVPEANRAIARDAPPRTAADTDPVTRSAPVSNESSRAGAESESGSRRRTCCATFLGPGPVRDTFVSAASAACLNGESGAQATADELSCRCYADRLADVVTDIEAERLVSGEKTLAMLKDRSGIPIKECFAVPEPSRAGAREPRTISHTDLVTPVAPVSGGAGKTAESSTARPRGFNPHHGR